MNAAAWFPKSAAWEAVLKQYERFTSTITTEQEKLAGTGFSSWSDVVDYIVASLYTQWIPLSALFGIAFLVHLTAAFWPKLAKSATALTVVDGSVYAVEFCFGAATSILLFCYRAGSDFRSGRTANLQTLAWMTIALFFVLNGILVLIHGSAALRSRWTRWAVAANYIFIGLLMIMGIGATASNKSDQLQLFAGLVFLFGGLFGAAASYADHESKVESAKAERFARVMQYGLQFIAAVLYLCTSPAKDDWPIPWVLANADTDNAAFDLLIFFWTWQGLALVVHLIAACAVGARGYYGAKKRLGKR